MTLTSVNLPGIKEVVTLTSDLSRKNLEKAKAFLAQITATEAAALLKQAVAKGNASGLNTKKYSAALDNLDGR